MHDLNKPLERCSGYPHCDICSCAPAVVPVQDWLKYFRDQFEKDGFVGFAAVMENIEAEWDDITSLEKDVETLEKRLDILEAEKAALQAQVNSLRKRAKYEFPDQPIELDFSGRTTFVENKLVRYLLDWAQPRGMGMNEMAALPGISNEERAQFAQLIGYSLDGYSELSYVSNELWDRACQAQKKLEDESK